MSLYGNHAQVAMLTHVIYSCVRCWNQPRSDPKCNGALSIPRGSTKDVHHNISLPTTPPEDPTDEDHQTSLWPTPNDQLSPSIVLSDDGCDDPPTQPEYPTDEDHQTSPRSTPNDQLSPSIVLSDDGCDDPPTPPEGPTDEHHQASQPTPNDHLIHPQSHNETTSGSSIYSCPLCGKEYKHYPSLHRHQKKAHPHERGTHPGTIKCLEEDCIFICMNLSQLRSHLVLGHHITMETQERTFQSYKGKLKLLCTCGHSCKRKFILVLVHV